MKNAYINDKYILYFFYFIWLSWKIICILQLKIFASSESVETSTINIKIYYCSLQMTADPGGVYYKCFMDLVLYWLFSNQFHITPSCFYFSFMAGWSVWFNEQQQWGNISLNKSNIDCKYFDNTRW